MSFASLDISWQLLRDIVRDWAGSAAELDEVKPLHGGYVNTTVALHCKDDTRAVLKITPHRIDRAYADESAQLAAMRAAGVPVPEVYQSVTGTLEHPFSYLLMEFVEGIDFLEARRACSPDSFAALQEDLADVVQRLHNVTANEYGRVTSEAGTKRWQDWAACYREWFDPIRLEVSKSGLLPTKCRKTVAKVHDRLDRLLAHDDRPRLVHWDLWSTNILARPDANGDWRVAALLDPACKYAHREAELAYLDLFHTCNGSFLRAYQHASRLSPDYHRVRKLVYQLYSMLNQLHCHGADHLRQTIEAIERVAALV